MIIWGWFHLLTMIPLRSKWFRFEFAQTVAFFPMLRPKIIGNIYGLKHGWIAICTFAAGLLRNPKPVAEWPIAFLVVFHCNPVFLWLGGLMSTRGKINVNPYPVGCSIRGGTIWNHDYLATVPLAMNSDKRLLIYPGLTGLTFYICTYNICIYNMYTYIYIYVYM